MKKLGQYWMQINSLTERLICIIEKSFNFSYARIQRRRGEKIARRSYQYVALNNIINKGAMDPENPSRTGWNNCYVDSTPKDHNLKIITRPNNDTLYIFCSFD